MNDITIFLLWLIFTLGLGNIILSYIKVKPKKSHFLLNASIDNLNKKINSIENSLEQLHFKTKELSAFKANARADLAGIKEVMMNSKNE